MKVPEIIEPDEEQKTFEALLMNKEELENLNFIRQMIIYLHAKRSAKTEKIDSIPEQT